MKNTFRSILTYVVILTFLLGISAVAKRLKSETEPAVKVTTEETPKFVNAMDESGATDILLEGETAHIIGVGAAADDSGVTIAYPGTYHITGTMTAGQILVDCGDYEGHVYLILDNASVTYPEGPAILAEQCDAVTVYLAEGSENTLRDGEGYTVEKGQEMQSGACILSDDDLAIGGSGTLYVYGVSADGIRSRDGLDITGGSVIVYAAEHGIQGSDYVNLEGTSITVGAYGDGVRSTKGDVTVKNADVTVNSAGDGISAEENVYVRSGTLSVVACGGSENYAYAENNALSAKGIKGENVLISGGSLTLDTADDAVKAEKNVTVTGGVLTVRTGDDGLSAGGIAELTDGDLTVETSYEGIEGQSVVVSGGMVSLVSDNNAVQCGDGGFEMSGGTVYAAAPCCVSSGTGVSLSGGYLCLSSADSGESILSFADGAVSGGTVIALGNGSAETLLADGAMPQSLAFALRTPVSAGTAAVLYDNGGNPVLVFTLWQDSSFVQLASGAMCAGQSYTLSVGDMTLTGTLAEECVIIS